MSTTHIYIVRHGQSEGNLHNAFLGHTDLDLTELGHKQAELTADYLDNISFDAIYSSDLLRAYNTGKHTADRKGLPIIKSERLREIFAGEWENKTFDALEREYYDDFTVTWKKDIGHARCTGGESVEELQNRFVPEVERIAKENEGKTIAIFTHATPIRVLKAAIDGISLDELMQVPWAGNASVTHVVVEDGKFSITEYGVNHFLGEFATVLSQKV